jgi:2Fe-2S ferredoxin
MVDITMIEHDGTVHELAVETGQSLMQAALTAGVPGIDADCGGACACATCHVYVDAPWRNLVGACSAMESAMLDFAHDPAEGSRLACQIAIHDGLSGLVVRLPESQKA